MRAQLVCLLVAVTACYDLLVVHDGARHDTAVDRVAESDPASNPVLGAPLSYMFTTEPQVPPP